jgi:phosphoglycolate phosphatase-like HAD superfamily hydrolase
MGAAQIVAELSPRGEKDDFTLPATEKQVRSLALLDSPEDRRKAWMEALQQAGEAEVPSRLVSRVVQGMIKKGKKRRSKKRVSKKEPEKLQIDREAVAMIRQRLADIRKAAKGIKGIKDAVLEIEALLPG